LRAYDLSPLPLIDPTITLWQQFLPVILFSIVVAASSVCVLRVPVYLRNWPLDVRLILLTLLAFLTLIILWLAIMLAYIPLSSPIDSGVAPTWVLLAGGSATLFLVLGILYWADHLYWQAAAPPENG
jgi:hypothetical protein